MTTFSGRGDILIRHRGEGARRARDDNVCDGRERKILQSQNGDPPATKCAQSCPKGTYHVTMGPGETAGGTIILPEEVLLFNLLHDITDKDVTVSSAPKIADTKPCIKKQIV